MAITLISALGLLAGGTAGAAGIGQGAKGVKKLFTANKKNKKLKDKLEKASIALKDKNDIAIGSMDELGKLEMETLSSFNRFSNKITKIHNKPDFDEIKIEGFVLPQFNPEKLEDVSTGAATLLAGASGGTSGILGGFAAVGAVKAAVISLGTASTGTTISSLSGAALTNATLAALGGGSIAAGGGGIALGTTVLGVSTAGLGLLVGGFIFNTVGNKTAKKVDNLEEIVIETEQKADKIITYLDQLEEQANNYIVTLKEVIAEYNSYMRYFEHILVFSDTNDWNKFSEKEKIIIETLVLLVGLLYSMCQVNIVIETTDENEVNQINQNEIDENIDNAKEILTSI